MSATYRALREHGYADLTIQQIADEFEKSKSLIYYHYDTRTELLVAFIDHLLERYLADLDDLGPPEGETSLSGLVDHLLTPDLDDETVAFWRAMLELRAQAAHDERFREQFRTADERIQAAIADYLREAAAAGVVECNPDRTARFLRAAANGAILRAATLDEGNLDAVRAAMLDHLERLAPGDQ
jgi:AcrR family transcriptional regulator